MIYRPTTHRPGTSLLEVLVGLGIMSVGALGAFVLFPLATINVSRALVDDRATTCAITADNALRNIHRENIEAEARGEAPEPYQNELDNPVIGATLLPPDGPSAPVFVDPMGIAAGRGPVGTVRRVTLKMIAAQPNTAAQNLLALRFCSQMDGLAFNEQGEAASANLAELRELRYNWLWVLQRPVFRDRHTVRQQVVVFDKRAHMYAPPGSEAIHAANFTPGETSITGVPLTAEVRKGSWVMDGTFGNVAEPVDPAVPTGARVPRMLRHAEFYRVVSVTEVGGTYTLEVHKPVTRPDGFVFLPNTAVYAYSGSLVVMPAVVEVFERGLLTDRTGK